ncbi:MAG: hypothetical protein KAJ55_08000 [Anaerolineales bacterium]|nr:hypothetical protein [Anaerolineales bacterium]
MRRIRLGLTLPQGGWPLIDRMRAVVQPELGWDDDRWTFEQRCLGKTLEWQLQATILP